MPSIKPSTGFANTSVSLRLTPPLLGEARGERERVREKGNEYDED